MNEGEEDAKNTVFLLVLKCLVQEGIVMGVGKMAGAGIITWIFGGGLLMFIIVFALLKAC